MTTPLISVAWEKALDSFPDQALTEYILRGIHEGFRIGFNYRLQLRSRSKNMSSTNETPCSVVQAVEKEAGRLLPVQPKHHLPQSKCQISPFGVIPKRYQPGKWRRPFLPGRRLSERRHRRLPLLPRLPHRTRRRKDSERAGERCFACEAGLKECLPRRAS